MASNATSLTFDKIAKAACQNDIVTKSVFQALNDRVGRPTDMLINMLDPDIIARTGRLAGLERLDVNVPRKLLGCTVTGKSATNLVRTGGGDDAIVAGAVLHDNMAF